MQPDLDTRLKAMLKAMTDVVLPAVDATNASAQEQARLVAASLAMIREQVDYLHWYAATEAHELAGLARALTEVLGQQTCAPIEAARQLAMAAAARADVPTSTLTSGNRVLRDAISAAIADALGSEDAARRAQVERLVLQFSEPLLRLERAFVARSGFEVEAGTLDTIGDTLESMRR